MEKIPLALQDDNPRDRMPIYLKVMPRPAQKFYLKYCTSPVKLAIGIIFFLIILPLLLQNQIQDASNGINNIFNIDPRYKELISGLPKNRWSDLFVQYRKEKLNEFTPFRTLPGTKCIDREKYAFELVRYLNLDPYFDDLSKPHILLVGDNTDLGSAILNNLQKNIDSYTKKLDDDIYHVAHCGCQHNIDFSSGDAPILLDYFNISRAIITCPEVLPKYSTTDGAKFSKKFHSSYLKGLFRILKSKSIPFVYAAPDPIDEQYDVIVSNYGGKLVTYPMLMSHHSLISKSIRECQRTGKSRIEIYDTELVSDLSANVVAEYLINSQIENLPPRVNLRGSTLLSIRDVFEKIKETQQCKIDIVSSPHSMKSSTQEFSQVKLKGSPSLINEAIKKKKIYDSQDDVYLTITVVGRHDNFSNGFEDRTQNFLNAIGKGLERHPLANIELVFVDYSTPSDKAPLSDIFEIPKTLKGKIRFITVPESRHKKLQKKFNSTLPFFEYIAKNIGIRRSKGKFILSTNPDNILPSTFFQLVEQEDFHEGVFYRSIRWDTRDNTFQNITVDDLYQAIGEPWRLKEFDVKQRCHEGNNRFLVATTAEKFLDQAYPCGGGDFIMLSQKLWESTHAFDEVPANPNVDAVFMSKMMKMIPGHIRFFIHPLNIHQKHEKVNVKRASVHNHDKVMAEYSCNGESKTLGKWPDTYRWGLYGETFEETIK